MVKYFTIQTNVSVPSKQATNCFEIKSHQDTAPAEESTALDNHFLNSKPQVVDSISPSSKTISKPK